MKKEIVIITINDVENYGNRLQNFALHTLLSEYSNVQTAFCSKNPSFLIRRANYLKWLFKNLLMNFDSFSVIYRRYKRCLSFMQKYTPDNIVGIDSVFGVLPRRNNYIYVFGSDQIWNYNLTSNPVFMIRLGSFLSPTDEAFSYAASFGVSEVDDEVKPFFQKYLPRLKAISVREDCGAELIRGMTGLDAKVVLDPTLMITADKWLDITENFVPNDDRYVLTYFLGQPSDEQERDIQSYAKEHGCRVRRMLDLRDKETYVAGPQDFVELFSKTQYVFTDSYHACCFSILFHKQFTVFNRAAMTGKSSMNSRMETLFRLFDLDSVMMDSGLAPEIDYAKVDRLLEQHRRESQAWLDKAMEE